MRRYIENFLAVALILTSIVGFGQEYDDLYFNKSSREKQKKKKVDVEISRIPGKEELIDTNQNDSRPTSFLGKQYDVQPLPEDLAAEKTISQESYDFYKPDKTIKDYTNANFSTPGNTNQTGNNLSSNQNKPNANFSDPVNTNQNDPVIINNYYSSGWNTWGRPRWNAGFGWNNWGGNFWNAGFGWGGWYDPFWDPWFYDPFWGPAWGWNAGFGWNNWGWGSAWCPPGFYNGFGGRRVALISNNINRGRTVVKSPRNSRGGELSSSGRTRNLETPSVTSNRRSESLRRSRQQRDYLNKSRSSRYSNSVSGTNSQRSRSRNSTYNSGNSSRQSGNSLNQRSRSNTSNRSNSYNNGSGSRSRSSNFGTSRRSRSSGSSRSVNFSNSSRRSGAVRSSGSVRSRSSGSSGSSSGRSRNRSGSRRRN